MSASARPFAVLPTFVRDRPRLAEAAAFSAELHRGQLRQSDHAPFVLHPFEVAASLEATGATDDVLVAAVLHDAVENTDVGLDEIERRFGARAARLVRAVSSDATITDDATRKAALREQVARADDDAVLVFTADKLCKVRELRLAGGAADPVKLEHYRASLELASGRLGAHPLVRLLRFELETRELLPSPTRSA